MPLVNQSAKTNWKFLGIAVIAVIVIGAGLLWWGSAIRGFNIFQEQSQEPGQTTLQGFVQFTELEGGCWYILVSRGAADAEQIELIGIEENTLEQYEERIAEVSGRFRDDMASVCQIGRIFEVDEISLADHPANVNN